jgi:TPR repeat protein
MEDTDAQFTLASYYHDQVAEEAAVLWYERAAERGHLEAQVQLGSCYLFGTGVDKHLTVAATWFEKAAVRGHAGAQYLLACCKKTEQSGKDYYSASRTELRKAAERWFYEAAERWGVPQSSKGFNSSDR